MKRNIFRALIILTICFSINVVKAWSCTYYQLDYEKNKSANQLFTLKPGSSADKVILDYGTNQTETKMYTGNYDVDCDWNIFKQFDQYVLGNNTCIKMKDEDIWRYSNENTCSYYIYTIDTSDKGKVYVAGDRDPAQVFNFKDVYEYVGQIKNVTNDKGVSSTGVRSEINPLPRAGDSTHYSSFYNKQIQYRRCGNLDHIPKNLPVFSTALYKVIKFLVPVILILMGVLDFAKAVMSKDENEMNSQKQKFIRRLIAAVLIFFALSLVQFIVNLTGTADTSTSSCIDCFINNANKCETYVYQGGQKNS